jgi:predicted ATP-grasp superfamily ATP-dependent carboligase
MRIFLAVARSLGRAGVEVHAIPFDRHAPALKSRYVKKVHQLPLYSVSPGAWKQGVLELLDNTSYDLVIPCCDRAILALDINRGDFTGHRIAMPNPRMMELLFDKERTHEMCVSLDIPVVKEVKLNHNTAARELAETIGFPLVLKPRRSYWPDKLDTWGKVHIIDGERDLGQTLSGVDDRSRYLAQSYFEGAGTGVSVLAREGEILQAFQHRRLRERRGGVSTCRISEPVDAALLQACEKICRTTSLTGVCMFEFRCNLSTYAWVLIEVNARFWGSLPLPVSLKVDFPIFLFDLMVEGRVRPSTTYEAGVWSRNMALDGLELLARLRRLKRGEAASWLRDVAGFATQPFRWFTGAERSDSFVSDDLRPAFWEIFEVLRQVRLKLTGLAAQAPAPPASMPAANPEVRLRGDA